jgi:hypothetical protein
MFSKALLLFSVASLALAQQSPVELASLRYIDLVIGNGEPAAAGKRLTVHYTGWLKDGAKFDSSLDRNEPFSFVQGRRQVITGWDVGFEGMKVGGKRKLFIPYQLAYGESGTGPIPPKAELVFEVELLKVDDAPSIPPAVDVLLPYADLESKVLTLARELPQERFDAVSPALLKIVRLNQAAIENTTAPDSAPKNKDDLIALLSSSFAAVRHQLEPMRNGVLSADATLGGKPTTRRGLFVSLDTAIAEQYGRADELARRP